MKSIFKQFKSTRIVINDITYDIFIGANYTSITDARSACEHYQIPFILKTKEEAEIAVAAIIRGIERGKIKGRIELQNDFRVLLDINQD